MKCIFKFQKLNSTSRNENYENLLLYNFHSLDSMESSFHGNSYLKKYPVPLSSKTLGDVRTTSRFQLGESRLFERAFLHGKKTIWSRFRRDTIVHWCSSLPPLLFLRLKSSKSDKYVFRRDDCLARKPFDKMKKRRDESLKKLKETKKKMPRNRIQGSTECILVEFGSRNI